MSDACADLPLTLPVAERAALVARSWIDTPYHHQASVKGVGCDCLGLVRGVYAELYGCKPETPPPYTRDLAEATGVETLIEAARRHLVEVDLADVNAQEPNIGDVIVFRLRRGAMAKHCAIVSRRFTEWQAPRMIHAFESGPVCEVTLCSWWWRRRAAIFRFPEEVR